MKLTQTIKAVIFVPPKNISPEEAEAIHSLVEKDEHPLIKATSSNSTRNLNNTSVHYRIQTNRDETEWVLSLNKDIKGIYASLPFPIETPMEKLVTVILDHVQQFPRVLKERKTPKQ